VNHRRFVLLFVLAIAAAWGLHGYAQGRGGQAPPPAPPINQSSDPLLKDFRFRSIGPANIGGRVDDIAVVESNPATIYIGLATGGVLKTVNNGTTWTPIFETYSSASIGDIAVSQKNPDIVWVGTGEPNNRQSSSFGDGIYKSTDAGKTFVNVGLKDSQSIARIVIDPRNDDTVYVAVGGHLFGPNPERGLFKTIDGGKTWTRSKFIDDDTGFTDVVMDAHDPNTLYAASYQRRRTAWGFNGSGPGSAIWKTTDAGKSWTKLSGNGLPDNQYIGRIGIDVGRSKPGVVVAQIEVGASGGTGAGVNDEGQLAENGAVMPGRGGAGGETQPAEAAAGAPGAGQAAQAGGGRGPVTPPPLNPNKTGIWRSDDRGKTWHLTSNTVDRPMYYSQVRVDPTNDQIIYQGGAPFYKSIDGGKTFQNVQGVAHSDHHAIWIDPKNTNHVIIGNDGGIDVTYDQGATWEYVNNFAAGLFYAVSADMRKPYYVCGGLQDNGSWCGPSATRSNNGIINEDWFRVGGGDGFYTQNDPTDWTTIYAESQDGATQRLDLRTGRTVSVRPRGVPPPQGRGAGRGAGATAALPPGTPPQIAAAVEGMTPEQIAALAAQFGFGGQTTPNIVPTPGPDVRPRFYWNTPILLSPHNPRTLYIGGDRLFISRDRGNTFTMTADLTKHLGRNERPIMGVAGDKPMASKHDGAASYSNIVTIAESPAVPGILWVGTNDGNLQVSRDGGATWKNVADSVPGVPKETHVSRVEASHFDAGTCYVTFDGHRSDDMKPYVFVTRDYGATWTSLSAGLPMANVNVIREDPKNKNLLFLGTEYAFYVSLNGGKEWKRFMNGLPTVRIDDILIHARDNDLIVGTHGRSIFIMDDITPLQQLANDKVMTEDVHLFDVRPAVLFANDIMLSRQMGGAKHFVAQNPPRGPAISYFLKGPVAGDVKIAISDITGKVLRDLPGTNVAGINRVQWTLTANPPQLPPGLAGRGFGGGGGGGRGGFNQGPPVEPGTYLVKLSAGGKDYTTKVVVEADDMGR
jgi:photosystem II stability/assembly factor-like uncharacterized protein